MADTTGGMGARSAHDIDRRFQEDQHNLVLEHRRQERRMLAYHKGELDSFARNREAAEARYLQRLARIERGYERAALAVEKRHNSIAGRLERLTRGGRERQEATREALDERRAKLDRMAAVNFRALGERQFAAEQADRIFRARELKLFRQDHIDARQEQAQRHADTRARKIEGHTQTLQRAAAEQALRQGLQELNQDRGGRTIAR